MRCLLLLLALSLAFPAAAQAQTANDKDQRMGWWRDARFGLFIHWGLYAIPAGKWGDRTDYGEWIRDSAHIPIHEYEKLEGQFYPQHFDADQWVKMAKAAGMKYIVITTKHHDGFNLFDTKYSDWSIAHTPFHRDVMKELADACHKEGMQIGWYHSIMDWHEPDYLPRRGWEEAQRPADGADFKKYVQYLHNEVNQLLTGYGPIGVMWFDGQWERTWNDKYGKDLYNLCRKIQPNVIVNDRVSNRPGELGDYTTPEQVIPDTGLPGVDWETCMTMNDHWGYNAYDTNWKSSKTLIRNLVDIASKGGNYLLNIGPTADGEFPPEAVQRLHDIGAWMGVNSDSIYGTTASVFDALPWGRSTTKRDGKTTTLYLQVFDWPTHGRLVVPALASQPLSAKVLGSNDSLRTERQGPNVVIDVPSAAPSDICSVVALQVEGEAVVYRTPIIKAPSPLLVHPELVAIQATPASVQIHYTLDGTDPDANSPIYTQPIIVSDTSTIRAAAFSGGTMLSGVATSTITKADLQPAAHVGKLLGGLTCSEYKGDWDKMPDFSSLKPDKVFNASQLSVPHLKGVLEEYVGRVYEGYLSVPADEVYAFDLTSDDGSRLWIDGKLAVDNDGLHGSTTVSGFLPLAKGWHKIRIEWFNKTGDAVLRVSYGAAGGVKEELRGPALGRQTR